MNVFEEFQKLLPKHECELCITHNEHLNMYETVESTIEDRNLDVSDFVSEEDMKLCIKSNDMWSIQWYPHTPIGFSVVYGSSLKLIMEHING